MDGFEAMDKELEDFKKSYGKEERDLTPREKYSYKRSMRRIRERHGLTDGLRTDRAGFKEYLKKRREQDAKDRPGRYFSR